MKSKEERIVTKTYAFKLTDQDYIEIGKRAAKEQLELAQLEDRFKEVKDEWKHKIKMQNHELQTSLRVIRAGEELREVECTEIKDFDRLTVAYVYEGEVMEERAMTEKERQIVMDLAQEEKNHAKASGEVVHLNKDQRDLRDVMRSETNKRTKKDHLQ